jgi:hypothetical protein
MKTAWGTSKKLSLKKLLRSSPALPDFRAGELPARIFFMRML